MARPVLVIANRRSRHGGSDLSGIVERLRAGGLEVELVTLPSKHGVEELVRRHGRGKEMVILGGGDGTMNQAAEALLETGLPLGVLPLGTANDLARTLGIPPDPLAAVEVILKGHRRRIDLGQVNGKHFFNVASVGLSVAVAQQLTPEVKRRLGVMSYPLTLYRVLRSGRSFSAEVSGGGRRFRLRSIQLAVGNGKFYGGGMAVSETAAIDDHLLHFYALKPRSLWRLAWQALAFRQGRHRANEAVEAVDGTEFEITTKRSMRVNTDGEITTRTPARFKVVPNAIEVFTPG